MTLLITTEAVGRERVAELARDHGLAMVADVPWTHSIRSTQWRAGELVLSYVADGYSGTGLIRTGGDLVERVVAALPCETEAEALARAHGAVTVRDRVRTAYRLGAMLLVPLQHEHAVLAALGQLASDEDALVRWAAARVLGQRANRSALAVLEAAATMHPDLAPIHDMVRGRCEALEDGTLHDAPTDSWGELVRRAREGKLRGQWRRVELATEALLAEDTRHVEGLLLRALAYEHAGNLTLAVALLGAAEAEQALQSRLAMSDATEDDADGDGAGAAVDLDLDDADSGRQLEQEDLDELPGAARRVDRRASGEIAGQLAFEIAEALARIVPAAEEVPLEVREAAGPVVLAWLERWTDATTARAGAARWLLDLMPSLEGPLAFVAGQHDGDVTSLRRAVAAAPGSPEPLAALGVALARHDLATAIELVEEAYGLLIGPAEGETAELITRLAGGPPRATALIEHLATLTYEAQDWDRAAELADHLVAVDPDAALGWQIRANARTFADRHEEAVMAYHEALVELDRMAAADESSWLGSDPRPGMRFNLACVLARLGHRVAALDELRHAVRASPAFAEDARTDAFFTDLWDDPSFRAIVDGDARALVVSEELGIDHLDGRLARARDLLDDGRAAEALLEAERAAELAGWGGHPHLGAIALALTARAIVAVDVDDTTGSGPILLAPRGTGSGPIAAPGPRARAAIDRALTTLTRADDLAVRTDAPIDVSAELAHARGLILQAAGRHDEAVGSLAAAVALREADEGGDPLTLVRAYTDLARLDGLRGEPPTRIADLYARAIETLEQALPFQVDARRFVIELAVLHADAARVHIAAGARATALEDLTRARHRLAEARTAGVALRADFVAEVAGLARSLASHITQPALRARADSVADHLAALGPSSSPAEAAERRFWQRLRTTATHLRDTGVTDAALAAAITRAIRGEPLPASLHAIPVLAALAADLAVRVRRYPTLSMMIAVNLTTVEGGGDFATALRNLEELCVGALLDDGTLTDFDDVTEDSRDDD